MNLKFKVAIEKEPVPLTEIGVCRHFSFSSRGYAAATGNPDIWIKCTAIKAINLVTLQAIKLSEEPLNQQVYVVRLINQ